MDSLQFYEFNRKQPGIAGRRLKTILNEMKEHLVKNVGHDVAQDLVIL